MKSDDSHCTLRLKVALRDHFLGWIFALGSKVRIICNQQVLDKVGEMVGRLNEQYDTRIQGSVY